MKNKNKLKFLSVVLTVSIFLSGCNVWFTNDISGQNALFIGVTDTRVDTVYDVPEFTDEPYVIINDNKPEFTAEDLVTESYEFYSELDYLGRCGVAMACVGTDIMPTEERSAIGMIKPTGWHTVKYENVNGRYLYNRCHLIGYQLTGENDNEKNLITGTRYLNIDGMLPFEDFIADYVKTTQNHVIYRVTPIFKGENLLASGVQIEAMSVEDGGEGVCFNIYAYNSQPDIVIDYATGNSHLKGESADETVSNTTQYIINKSSMKFHTTDCSYVKSIKSDNKEYSKKTAEELKNEGYVPCKVCIG